MKYPVLAAQIKRLETNFTYHAPKDDQPQRYKLIRGAAHDFAMTLMENCPESRELSIALTKIEEAVMWANAAIARYE